MLLPSDCSLINRDADLPGLRILLDVDLVHEFISRQIPEFRGAIKPLYLRYKPHMNCLAAYQFTFNGQEIDIHAKAYRTTERSKLEKHKKAEVLSSKVGKGVHLVPEMGIVLSFFPNDAKLKSVARLDNAEKKELMFQRLFRTEPSFRNCELEKLTYKPERRYVAKLMTNGVSRAVLRCYLESDFFVARSNAKVFRSSENIRIPKKIAHSKQNSWIVYEWLSGFSLDPAKTGLETFRKIGSAIAELHFSKPKEIRDMTRESIIRKIMEQNRDLSHLYPDLQRTIRNIAGKLAAQLVKEPPDSCAIHGDFNVTQIVIQNETIGIVDLDEIVRGDAAFDLGTFMAGLEREELLGKIPSNRFDDMCEALLDGYRSVRDLPQHEELYRAIGLFRLVAEPFRYRQPDWFDAGREMLLRIQTIVSNLRKFQTTVSDSKAGRDPSSQVSVIDPFGVLEDKTMGFLANALAPLEMQFHFGRHLPFSKVHTRSIRVTRYKAERRCLLEYEIQVSGETVPGSTSLVTLIGKARAKGPDRRSFQILQHLYDSSFSPQSKDGIFVPQPVGLIPDLHMYLQKKVHGVPASELFRKATSPEVSNRIAEAIHKLHQTHIPGLSEFTVQDELQILRGRLALVSEKYPHLQNRIQTLFDECESIADKVQNDSVCCIHRDFYPDQVLFQKDQVFLIDFDTCRVGHPALDAGNFMAHIIEQSLRERGIPDAWSGYERAFRTRFIQLSGLHLSKAVEIYTILSLARHIYLSTQFAERISLTEPILKLCEDRISAFRFKKEKSWR